MSVCNGVVDVVLLNPWVGTFILKVCSHVGSMSCPAAERKMAAAGRLGKRSVRIQAF